MSCGITGKKLWSWIDREAPELDEHLAVCPKCRAQAQKIRAEIGVLTGDQSVMLPLPETIGPYRIERLIGEGGQALVFEAEQPSPRRKVALKVLKGGQFAGKDHLKRFRRETQTLAKLNHPCLATIYEAGCTEDGLHFFAMELIAGMPLRTYVGDQALTLQQTVELFLKICQAVHYAHRHGVIHRDLKPDNILIVAGGEPKILDFGLARVTDPDGVLSATMTKVGRVAGTPRYMSPEQVRGFSNLVDARSDVYSLGVILYELVTGTPPHEVTGLSHDEVRAICEEIPRRPGRLNRAAAGDLETIVLKCLAKAQNRRYQSAGELADDLHRYHAAQPVLAKPPGRLLRARRWTLRHRAITAVVFLVLLLALVAFRVAERVRDTRQQTRYELIDLRHELLEGESDDWTLARARNISRDYAGLPETVLLSAQAYCAVRAFNYAIDKLESALEGDPTAWWYRVLLTEIRSSETGVPDSTVNVLPAGVEVRDTAEAWYLGSFATLDASRALAWTQEVLQRDPTHALALQSAARLYRISGDNSGAIAAATRLQELEIREAYWTIFKIDLLVRSERLPEAARECDHLERLSPQNTSALMRRAKIKRRLGDYAGAVADFERTLALRGVEQPAQAWIYYHLGTLEWILDRPESALQNFRTAYQFLTYPTYANARLVLILRDLGRSAEARTALAEARAGIADSPWLAMILACLDGDRPATELIASAENAQQLCEAYYYAGEIHLQEGRVTEARDHFSACLATGISAEPGNPLEAMSEFELATWRLARLDRQE